MFFNSCVFNGKIADFFQNQIFRRILQVRNTIKVTNSFDTDQANVWSGLISGSIWDKLFAKCYQQTALVVYYYTLKVTITTKFVCLRRQKSLADKRSTRVHYVCRSGRVLEIETNILSGLVWDKVIASDYNRQTLLNLECQ